ncbi:MAG: hypothetical protein KAW13_05605 [Dehalococcoidia bacterium]|nr:hypothetical protein [Dehalococcoidia bacterium]
MSEKTGLNSIIPSGKEIGFIVIRGFALFLSVSGMVGMALILGPLNHILQDMEFTLVFGSKAAAFFSCLGLAVVGGALDFFANLGIKGLEKQR